MLIKNNGHATLDIECGGLRILTDPWLTPRLDRFWEHYPVVSLTEGRPDPDLVLLSHHHFDHFHLPSLSKLKRDAVILFPATQPQRSVTTPGGGVFAIPWLLRRLGFHRFKGLEPFERVTLGEVEIVAFPSAVEFPELAFLISDSRSQVFVAGDSLLHSSTVHWLESKDVHPNLAILPVHSTANDACFRDRSEKDDFDGKRKKAEEAFSEYVHVFRDSAVIPGAFGWRVSTLPGADEPVFDWMNNRIFPITIMDGYKIAAIRKLNVHVWGPGDSVRLDRTLLTGEGAHWDDLKFCYEICKQYELCDASASMPLFQPSEVEPEKGHGDTQEIGRFVENTIPQEIQNTPFFMQSIERGLKIQLRITGDDDICWIADFRSGKCTFACSDSNDFDASVWVAKSTFARLIQADIPLGHTWGCWVATSPLLDAVFSRPQYYCSYVDRLLNKPHGMEQYGY